MGALPDAYRNDDTLDDLAVHAALAPHLVFVFLDPWPILAGRAEAMVGVMRRHGFEVIASRLTILREADAEQIYRKNRPIRGDNSWHVARQIYAMGPSLGLVLYHRDVDTVDACTRMVALKGKSNPVAGRPGQLRFDFGAPNRCLSLMHSSDDWAGTLHEAIVFFPPALLARRLRAVAAAPGRVVGADGPALAVHDQPRETIADVSPWTLLIALRLRALDCIEQAAGAASAEAGPLRRLWGAALDVARQAPDTPAGVRPYLAMVERERAPVAALVAASDRPAAPPPRLYHAATPMVPATCALLTALADPPRYTAVDAEQLADASGLLRDRWERLLFVTTLYNFDDFLESR